MEARWRRRPGAVVEMVDVEVPEYPRLNSDSGVDVSRERESAGGGEGDIVAVVIVVAEPS